MIPIKDFELIQGTTFDALPLELLEDDAPMEIVDVKIEARKKAGGLLAFELSRSINANVITIEEQVIDVEPFNYIYDMIVIKPNDERRVYLKGNINILPKITKYNG